MSFEEKRNWAVGGCISLVALFVISLFVASTCQVRPTSFMTGCIYRGRVIYDNVTEDGVEGFCPSGGSTLSWRLSAMPLHVRAHGSPNYPRDPESTVRSWIDRFNSDVGLTLLIYDPEGPADVLIFLGDSIESGAEWEGGTAYTSHWVDRAGWLNRAIIGVKYVPDPSCEYRVGLHELGHVFMLQHSYGLMEAITQCGGAPSLTQNRYPDGALDLLRQAYSR